MSTIIKSDDRFTSRQAKPFNLDDVRVNAETYLAGIRQQAAEIVAAAHREADAIRRQAEAEGRRQGLMSVDAAVEARVQEIVGSLLPALGKVVAEIEQLRGAWLADWERGAVKLAAAMAARILGRETRVDPDVPLSLVRDALTLASGSRRVRIALSPTDHARLAQGAARVAAQMSRLAEVEIVADPAVELGGCRLQTDQGTIDVTFSAQLARLEEELT